MILLDTNILSALMRREPEACVVEWLNAQPSESVWTTSITVLEVRLGLELLAAGPPHVDPQQAPVSLDVVAG